MLKKFVLLFPLFLTACDDVKLALINTDIESPVRNTCQSADLDKDFPKCEENFHENYRSGNCVPWSAVVSSHDPVEAVLAKMPDGWAARISSADTLTAEQVDALKQRAGDAMELGF